MEPASKEKVVSGMKRTLPRTQQQSELPKKRHVVSEIDEENIQILAEVGVQPLQEQ